MSVITLPLLSEIITSDVIDSPNIAKSTAVNGLLLRSTSANGASSSTSLQRGTCSTAVLTFTVASLYVLSVFHECECFTFCTQEFNHRMLSNTNQDVHWIVGTGLRNRIEIKFFT
ncbi:hypothetical protein Trydic_g18784 [Trypoxylus dichotomus]